MTQIQTLWAQWLAENESATALEEQEQYATPTHRTEYATGAELAAAEPTCVGDCLIQLRHAELVCDWPAVSRSIDDVARLACIEPVPNPWDKPALAA